MLSARSRKAPTYGVTYVSLEDCTLHFETEYIIERRDAASRTCRCARRSVSAKPCNA